MLKLQYTLTQKEIEESLLCLSWRTEGKFKRWNILILMCLGGMLLIAYGYAPERFDFAMGSIAVIVLLLGILYAPPFLRRKKAKRIAMQNGYYECMLSDTWIQIGEQKEKRNLIQEKLRLFETERIFTLCLGKETLCIPKRILDAQKRMEFISIIKQNGGNLYHVV